VGGASLSAALGEADCISLGKAVDASLASAVGDSLGPLGSMVESASVVCVGDKLGSVGSGVDIAVSAGVAVAVANACSPRPWMGVGVTVSTRSSDSVSLGATVGLGMAVIVGPVNCCRESPELESSCAYVFGTKQHANTNNHTRELTSCPIEARLSVPIAHS